MRTILPVHLFGQSCSMTELVAFARNHHLHVIEDAAQAFGSRPPSATGVARSAGTVGDLGCFSFFPTKNLGGLGDGGLVATDQNDLAEKIWMLRVHGQSASYIHQVIGINSRLDEIQAAVLSVKLGYIDRWCSARVERARIYRELFAAAGLVGSQVGSLPEDSWGGSHVFHQFVLRVRRRDELKAHLAKAGIQTAVYYPLPLHLQPCFANLGYRKGDFPNAERVAEEALALPMYPELRREQQETVVAEIARFFRA